MNLEKMKRVKKKNPRKRRLKKSRFFLAKNAVPPPKPRKKPLSHAKRIPQHSQAIYHQARRMRMIVMMRCLCQQIQTIQKQRETKPVRRQYRPKMLRKV